MTRKRDLIARLVAERDAAEARAEQAKERAEAAEAQLRRIRAGLMLFDIADTYGPRTRSAAIAEIRAAVRTWERATR